MYLLNDKTYSVKPSLPGLPVDEIAPGYYNLFKTKMGFMWSPIEPFEINHRVYGSSIKMAPRILNSYKERKGIVTSAMFSGLKGSGKSLLMKRCAIDFVAEGGIVIVINEPFCGTEFNEFVQTIKQPVMFIIDEFEKVYDDKSARNALLSLLDGTVRTHALFILTSNEKLRSYRSNNMEFFHNRPSRIYYSIEFETVDMEAIHEFLDDQLTNPERKEEVLDFIDLFREFNMDMLSILVKEVNSNPDLKVRQLAHFLNIKPDSSMGRMEFKWSLIWKRADGVEVDVTSNTRGINPSRIAAFLGDEEDHLNVMVSHSAFLVEFENEDGETETKYERHGYDEYWSRDNAEMEKHDKHNYSFTRDGFTLNVNIHKPKYRKPDTISLL